MFPFLLTLILKSQAKLTPYGSTLEPKTSQPQTKEYTTSTFSTSNLPVTTTAVVGNPGE